MIGPSKQFSEVKSTTGSQVDVEPVELQAELTDSPVESADSISGNVTRPNRRGIQFPWGWTGLVVGAVILVSILWNNRPVAVSQSLVSGNGELVADVQGSRIALRRYQDAEPFDTIYCSDKILEAAINYRGTHIGVLTPAQVRLFEIDVAKQSANEIELDPQVVVEPTGLKWCGWDCSLCVWNQAGNVAVFQSHDGSLALHDKWGSEPQCLTWNHDGSLMYATNLAADEQVQQHLVDMSLPAIVDLPSRIATTELAAFDRSKHFLAVSGKTQIEIYSLDGIRLQLLEQRIAKIGNSPRMELLKITVQDRQPYAQFDLKTEVQQILFDAKGNTLALLFEDGDLEFRDVAALTSSAIGNYSYEAVNDQGQQIKETLNASPEDIRRVMQTKGYSVTAMERVDADADAPALFSTAGSVESINLQSHTNSMVVLFKNGQVQLFDAQQGKPIAEPLEASERIVSIAVPSDPPFPVGTSSHGAPRRVSFFGEWVTLPSDFSFAPPTLPNEKGEFPIPVPGKTEVLETDAGSDVNNPASQRVFQTAPWLPSQAFATITDGGKIDLWETQDLGRTFVLTFGDVMQEHFGVWYGEFGVSSKESLRAGDDLTKISVNDFVIISVDKPLTKFQFPDLDAKRVLALNACGCLIEKPVNLPADHVWQVLEPVGSQDTSRFNEAINEVMLSKHPALSSQELLVRVNRKMQGERGQSEQVRLRTFGTETDGPNLYFPRLVGPQQADNSAPPAEPIPQPPPTPTNGKDVTGAR